MDFFNKLGKKATQTFNEASKKTGEIAKEAKLRMKMNEDKSKINDIYTEIGKKVYERHTTKGEIQIEKDLEEELTKIDILSAEIETCLKEIMKLKNKKQCEKCFAELDIDAKFCGNCGAEQNGGKTDIVVVDNETSNTQANDVTSKEDTVNSDINQEVIVLEQSAENETNSNEINQEEIKSEETTSDVVNFEETNPEEDTNK